MANKFRIEGDIDIDRLAKYVRIDLEHTDELDLRVPCVACGIVEHLGSGPMLPKNVRECRESSDMTCPSMGGQKGSYQMVWWILKLAELAAKPTSEVAHIKCERYEEYEDEEGSNA